MVLSGSLSELTPAEIVQLLALTAKTEVAARRRRPPGAAVFRRGSIVSRPPTPALSFTRPSPRAGAMADSRLIEQVERRLPGSVSDSGTFLVEYREAAAGALDELVRRQIEGVVRELVAWEDGEFTFEAAEVPDPADVALDAGWVALSTGIDSNQLLLNALTKLDEARAGPLRERPRRGGGPRREVSGDRRRDRSDISAAFEVLVDPASGEVSWVPVSVAAADRARDPGGLRRLIDEAQEMQGLTPELTAEVALQVLRFAAQVVGRGVLLAIRGDTAQGIGQFGIRFADADARVRQLRIPAGTPSPLAPVVASGERFVGRLPQSPWSDYLLERIGGSPSAEVVLVPLVVEGAVLAVLYGDNLPQSRRLGAVDGLEILMREVGLGVEKARQERRARAVGGRA